MINFILRFLLVLFTILYIFIIILLFGMYGILALPYYMIVGNLKLLSKILDSGINFMYIIEKYFKKYERK